MRSATAHKAAADFKKTRAGWRKTKGIWPARCKPYRDFVRAQGCVVPNCVCKALRCDATALLYQVEFAHVGPHGISQKASDMDGVGLCHFQHQSAKDAQGKNRTDWFARHGVDLAGTQKRLRAEWEASKR